MFHEKTHLSSENGMSIQTKILLGFAISLMSLSIAGLTGYRTTQNLIETADWVAHTHKVKTLIESVVSQLKDAETGQRGYLLTGNPTYLEPYESGASAISTILARVKNLTIDNPMQQERIGQITMLTNEKLKELKETIDLYKAGNRTEAHEILMADSGKQMMDDIRSIIHDMKSEEAQLLTVRQQESKSAIQLATLITSFGFILAFSIIGAISIFIIREINRYITERRVTEANLQQYEHIVSTSLDLLAFFNREYIYQAVNDSYLNYFGKSRGEVIGHHASEILGQEVFENSIKPNMDKCLSGQRINYKIWLNYPKNGRRYMDVFYAPYQDSDGSISGFTADVRDITEKMQTEEELKKQRENMAHLVRVQTLGEMAAGIAHEINQPLAAINSYAEASKRHLQSGESRTEKVMELTGKISDQARRAGSVVSHLRAMMQNKISNPVALDINNLLMDVAELAEIETKSNDCKLIFKCSHSLPNVVCDAIQIQQVVLNLINNAIESMTDIAVDVEKNITVETRAKDNNYVEICVTDNGSGINVQDVDNIYEAFYTTKDSGLGMGLSICKSIIENHGGELGYSQNEAGGSRFYFSLPVEKSK